MKNVAKNEIILHDPYSNALCDSSCDNGVDAVIGGSLEKYLGEAQ